MTLGAAAAAAVVLLALWRVDVAVVIGVLLLGVVRVEPSPSDAFFSVAMLVVVLTGATSCTVCRAGRRPWSRCSSWPTSCRS